jgi:hypothetical protein
LGFKITPMKSMKLVTSFGFVFMLCVTTPVSSQNTTNLPSNTDAFGKGTNVINVGIGLGGSYSYIGPGFSSTPNFVVSYDNGTFGNVGPGIISLGGLLAYKGASFSSYDAFGYSFSQNWYYYIVGFRSAYHWNFTANSHFDPYAGLMLAYYDVGYNLTYNDPRYTGINPYPNNYGGYVALSLYIGARYYVSQHVGFWVELGYGYSDAALGVSFKF